MNIRDHGTWTIYVPAERPEAAPMNTMFSRRESDGVDWYDYSRARGSFSEGSIKAVVVHGAVGAANRDVTMLFSGNGRVLEITDAAEITDPQAAFGGKLYDAGAQTFSDPPPRGVRQG